MQQALGIGAQQLTPGFWIGRLHNPGKPLLDQAAIAAQNSRLLRTDTSMHDLHTLPTQLRREQVAAWIGQRSPRPKRALFDADGSLVAASTLDALIDALAMDTIPTTQPTGFGLVVQRAPLRSFPTRLRVFSTPGDTDIDRFQESALFPGTSVAIVHRSRDGQWLFVVSPRYAAWVEKRFVAAGSRQQVLAYAQQAPYRIVTGASARTLHTPENPALSELQLDMGVRMPTPPGPGPAPDQVNGQASYTSQVVELPTRDEDGKLQIVPALLPRTADVSAVELPLTRANIIGQAFKFLGERYGWGHDYNGRDCSGFVSEVYRSMGVLLPRNTGDQAASPALAHTTFNDTDTITAREAAVARLEVGDMVYIPGHVMLVIGRIDGVPWVIHDIQGGRILDADGQLRELHLNSVAVTPLPPLMFDADHRFIDRITSIVRIGAR